MTVHENTPRSVLLIDCPSSDRAICRDALRNHGIQVACQELDAQALADLRSQSYDAVLAFHQEGPAQLLGPILSQAAARSPRTPVICCLADDRPEMVDDCLQRGALECLSTRRDYWRALPTMIERVITTNQAQTRTALLAAVVESTHDPILSTDPMGLIRSWNPAAEQHYGWQAAHMIGQSLTSIVPETQQAELAAVVEAVRAGGHRRIKGDRCTRSGATRPILSAMSAIHDPVDGHVIGIAVVDRDLSEQHRRLVLEEQNHHLQQVNNELDNFAAFAAHDLQAPIRTAHLSLDLLAENSTLDQDQHHLLVQAQESLRYSRELVQRILEYSRQTTITHEQEQDIALQEIIDRALGNLQARIRDCHPDIQVSCPHMVHFHATHLLRLIQNLVGNALQYQHPDRQARIGLHSRAHGSSIVLSIRDNGLGMDRETQQEVFQLFRRSDEQRGAGFGIGLAVCQRLVEARGGHIDVDSQPEVGTCFHVYLPPAQQATQPTASARLRARNTRRPSGTMLLSTS